jgi:hypothetical protein
MERQAEQAGQADRDAEHARSIASQKSHQTWVSAVIASSAMAIAIDASARSNWSSL